MIERLRTHGLRLLATSSLLALFGSCASPTQIVVRIHTDMPCTGPRWQGFAIAVGELNELLEQKAPARSSMECGPNGELATLVLTPSGEKNAEVGLRIVAGLDRQPEECAKHDYEGCVVARRALRFDRHDTVHVDVGLARSCIDFGCGADSTCVDGVCSPLALVPNTSTPPNSGSAGGGSGGHAGNDDAGADKGGTSGSAGGTVKGPSEVRCGDNGLFAPTTGNVCCLSIDRNAGTSTGECLPASSCPGNGIVLACDDESDCTDKADPRGFPGLCLLSYSDVPNATNSTTPDVVTAAACVAYPLLEKIAGKAVLGLCNEREPCLNDALCYSSGGKGSPLPNYHWCSEMAPFVPANPSANLVHCGDNGVVCGTEGDVCCLTVDRAAQTSSGECRPAATCPVTSIVLKCDDQSDCPNEVSATGRPGVCALAYEHSETNLYVPTSVSSAECMPFDVWFGAYSNGLGLCDRSSKCMGEFRCVPTIGEPTNPLPNYFSCNLHALEDQ